MDNNILIAEFRGLFWGEGSVLIVRVRMKSKYLTGDDIWTYRPALTMDLAEPEKETIIFISEKLGGGLYGPYKNSRSPNFRWRWRVDGFTCVPPFARVLLHGAVMPHPKINQMRLLLDFCDFRAALPKTHIGHEAKVKLRTYFDAMKALRRY